MRMINGVPHDQNCPPYAWFWFPLCCNGVPAGDPVGMSNGSRTPGVGGGMGYPCSSLDDIQEVSSQMTL